MSEVTARIGMLVGSLRVGANSAALARALPGLAPEACRLDILPSVGALPHFDQDILDGEGAPEAVTQLAEAVAALDGLILVTPEYNWSIPGALKNALDWLSRLRPMPLAGKPVLIVSNSPGLLGGARVHPPLREVLHALDCRILARPEIQIARVAGKLDREADRISDPDTAEFIAARLAAFAAFIAAETPGRSG